MSAHVSTGSPGNDLGVSDSFEEWVQSLPKPSSLREAVATMSFRRFPLAGSAGWLPDGWSEQGRFEEFYPDEDLYLVRAPGGWALVNHAAAPSPATGLPGGCPVV